MYKGRLRTGKLVSANRRRLSRADGNRWYLVKHEVDEQPALTVSGTIMHDYGHICVVEQTQFIREPKGE